MIGCSYYCILFIIFLIFFYNFFGLFYLILESCVCFWNIFTFLYFFSYIFPFFLTQVYRFYRNFLVFNFFHLFSSFLFYATAFLLNFIDYFPENVISDFNWIAAYIFFICSNIFLQVCCVIISGIEEVVSFQYICTLFIILHTLFRFLKQVYRYFCYLLVFQFLEICF